MPSLPFEMIISADSAGPSPKSTHEESARPEHMAPVYRNTSSVGGEPEHCLFSSIPTKAHEEPSLVAHATATLTNGDNDGATEVDGLMLCVGEALGVVGIAESDGSGVGATDVEGAMLCDGDDVGEVGAIEREGGEVGAREFDGIMLCDGEALGVVGRAEADGASVGTVEVEGLMLCEGEAVGVVGRAESDGASVGTVDVDG